MKSQNKISIVLETGVSVSNDALDPALILAEVRWKRIVALRKILFAAFSYTVIIGIELVHIKCSVDHGQFTNGAKKYLPHVPMRTIRWYRTIGEWFLSAINCRIMTVKTLKRTNTVPAAEYCTDSAVVKYLQKEGIGNSVDLEMNALELIPQLFKKKKARNICASRGAMRKLRRDWKYMNDAEQCALLGSLVSFLMQQKDLLNGANVTGPVKSF